MTYKILGEPYKRAEFKIDSAYKGIYRNDFPESKSQDVSIRNCLEGLYVETLSLDRKPMSVSELIKVAEYYTKFSTEKFELILMKETGESVPVGIHCQSLGYEVVANNGASMNHFWLRGKVEGFDDLYEKNIVKLNENYLFSCVEDAESFIEEIRKHTNIISPSADFEIDFQVVEILRVEELL